MSQNTKYPHKEEGNSKATSQKPTTLGDRLKIALGSMSQRELQDGGAGRAQPSIVM
ncbi:MULTISPECIES: hypothetical protein [Vibrio]|uniref:Uncharacterized protein n=1 Tax=Vibrio cyclitrophicus TaxID=47951 RepID=A0ACD5G657_9VIBR|nr:MULTISPECIES: hypothetical protein [Vibrio]